MNKQELLKQHPELVKEIARGVISLYNKGKAFSLDSVIEEYLKEQIKPEWEVLEFLTQDNLKAVPVCPFFRQDYDRYLKTAKIVEIRRTSDGEVFTVGDRLEGTRDTIKEIRVNDSYKSGIQLVTNVRANYGIALCEAVRSKPLFTTEDGIGVYEGDKYWIVGGDGVPLFSRPNFNFKEKIAELGTGQLHESRSEDSKGVYFVKFSTKEAAEEYILMNRPVLSVQDVWNIYGGHIDSPEQLRELAKSKL